MEGRSSSGELPMDTGAPFERVATCWRFSLGVERKGRASGRAEFVRHRNAAINAADSDGEAPFRRLPQLDVSAGRTVAFSRVRVTRNCVLLRSLPADDREHSVQFIRLHKNIARLGA